MVDFRFKIPDAQSYTASIYTHCTLDKIQQIEEVLSQCGELEMFKTSCFGNFLRFPQEMHFLSQLVHAVLAREIIVDDADESEMWFRIGNSNARFSKKEFCLVTGLSFGRLSDIINEEYKPVVGGIHERYFNLESEISKNTLWDKFKKGYFDKKEDAVKISLIAFVEYILWGADSRKNVTLWLFNLVEDLNEFNKFAWGKFFYQMTLYYLKKAARGPSPGKTVSRYNIYGFPWAFQIWVLEAIPCMDKFFGVKSSSEQHPRFLNWEKTKTTTAARIASFFLQEFNVLPSLEPSPDEMQQPYWQHIEDDINEGPQYTPPDYNFDKALKARREESENPITNKKRGRHTKTQSTTVPTHAKKKAKASHQSLSQAPVASVSCECGRTIQQEQTVQTKAKFHYTSVQALDASTSLFERGQTGPELKTASTSKRSKSQKLHKIIQELPGIIDALIQKNLAEFFRDRVPMPATTLPSCMHDKSEALEQVHTRTGTDTGNASTTEEESSLDTSRNQKALETETIDHVETNER
ncbi:hypothetical protein PTKIN_Ptkin01aG0351000 [Pterospermum kingtungense]